jgi:two-component system phosphate regulon sensor histidine kinase PhoR
LAEDDHWLQLIFQGKQDYFNLKMQYMSGASILILFSICALFVFAAYYLIKQQKISDENRQFFNHMTHEFSTPLTNIQLATKMMQRKSTSGNHLPYLDIIETQSNQLRYQVENVLHLATMEKENLKINKDLLDLNELAREAVDSMQLQIEEKQASVHIHPAQEPCQIRGDKFHLRNVFRNLIDNALKYCSNTPKVEIGFYPTDQGWCARVKDNGIGIPSEERDKIFNRFYRSPSSQETPTRGFGIGLAYVKRIIDLHQGDIRLGAALSAGTCFELYFPNTK